MRTPSCSSTIAQVAGFVAFGAGLLSGAAAIALAISGDPDWRGAGAISAAMLGIGLGLWVGGAWLAGEDDVLPAVGRLVGLLALVGGARLRWFGVLIGGLGAISIVVTLVEEHEINDEGVLCLAGGLAAVAASYVLSLIGGRAAGDDDPD